VECGILDPGVIRRNCATQLTAILRAQPVLEEARHVEDHRQQADDDDRQPHLADADPPGPQRPVLNPLFSVV